MLTELVADAATPITDQLTKLREKLIVICYEIQRNAVAAASTRLQQAYGKRFDEQLYRESQKEVAAMLGETISKKSIREQLTHAPAYHNVKPQREQPQR